MIEAAVRVPANRPEVHLRVLVPDDAAWVVAVDEETANPLARAHDWEVGKLEAELDEGVWASVSRWAWAVLIDGRPAGFVLVHGLDEQDAQLSIRLRPTVRGRGAGREVLRQLADHHFAEAPHLNRLTGRAHEHNIPMQRAFNAAGFRMEARYRDSFQQADGRYAAEWGYALTRADWEAGRHRSGAGGYDLHGLVFELDDEAHDDDPGTLTFRFLQEGRRAIARYDAPSIVDGELAGVLVDDLLEYRFVHLEERRDGAVQRTGRGRAQVQRRKDGRLELVDTWSADSGAHGRRLLVERRDS
jgi:RimJ/RimL family protein N-acetyltransferase